MSSETLRYDVISTADTRGLKDTARDAGLASAAAKELSDRLATQSKTAQVSAQASVALAKSDKILRDAELELSGAAEEARRALAQQARQAEESAAKNKLAAEAAKDSAGGFGSLASPLGAVVVAGAALAPIAVTLGAGLGGLALAAKSTIQPILEAGTATKQAQKALAGLDPAQRAAYQSLGVLKGAYKDFSKSLEPQVLTLFDDGLHLAAGALHELQPVAAATGNALHVVLGQVGAELQSGQWKQFFTWMAQQAGPDLQLVGKLLIDLLHDFPPLLEQLQPAGRLLLLLADGALKAVGGLEKLHLVLPVLGAAIGLLLGGGPLGALIGAFAGLEIQEIAAARATQQVATGFEHLAKVRNLDKAASVDWTVVAANVQAQLTDTSGTTYLAAVNTAYLAKEVQHLTDAYNKALSPLLAYSNAQIAQANDAANLNKVLHESHDRIGLATAAQRASFSAATQYIQDLVNTAQAASKSGQGIDVQIRSIQSALPVLSHVKGGTKDYWQEVQNLVGWLHRLQQQKAISEQVTVFGMGKWQISQGGLNSPHAMGGLITGGVPGRDSVPILAMPGEVVVPTRMVAAGAVDHLRGRLPGFAGGGVVPSYSGALMGLQPWAQGNNAATVTSLTNSIADALSRQIPAGFLGPGFGSYAADIQAVLGAMGLPLSLTANWLRQIQTESGGNLNAVNLTDSNAQAGHPSVGLLQLIPSTFAAYAGPYLRTPPLVNYGGGFVSEDPMAQIYAAIHYAAARYGGAAMAGVIGQGHGYDSGGYLPTGWSLAYNGTGRPEPVIPGGGGSGPLVIELRLDHSFAEAGLTPAMARNIKAYVRHNGGRGDGSVQVAFGN